MQEFEVGGVLYRTGKLDAFQQFHVFRRLGPVISGLIETFASARRVAGGGDTGGVAANPLFWSAVGPVANAIAQMSDQDSEFILVACLKTCTRRNTQGGWGPLTTDTGRLMFDDIDLMALFELTYKVLEDNLGNFFREGFGGLFGSPAQVPTPSNGSA